MSEDWLEYLRKVASPTDRSRPAYVYPVTDEVTNTRLQQQDPNKHTLEQALFSAMLQDAWRVAIDFGCGTGAHFFLFDGHEHRKNLLIGIDPDCKRVEWARQVAEYRLQFVQSHILCGGIELLEHTPKRLKADVVLCSQVLGHVSENQTRRIIKGFHRILAKNGRCGIAIPIVGAQFKENPQAGDWSGKEDYPHLVHMSKSPSDHDFRCYITIDEFNKAAEQPEPGLLPVRSFIVPNFPNLATIKLPYLLDVPPPTIGQLISPFFRVEKCAIYSIHKDPGSPVFPVGDMFIQLRKK
ncbi:MAG: class I SAM-dependent methyltransferase [Promethearchaeota archaeon]